MVEEQPPLMSQTANYALYACFSPASGKLPELLCIRSICMPGHINPVQALH